MKLTACAFTGHRPYKLPWKSNETAPGCIALKKIMTDHIAALADAGVSDFFTGGADGVDCWAAEIVLALREKNTALKLRCILPHERQADRWSASAQARYRSILKRADSVDYVSHKYYDGCLLDRNRRLVESADLLLAVFNGVRHSGTGATVNYARKAGRKLIIIDPVTLHTTYEGITRDILIPQNAAWKTF